MTNSPADYKIQLKREQYTYNLGIGNILIIVIFMIKISCDNCNHFLVMVTNDATKFPVLSTITLTLFIRQIKLTI